ncbi:hypothetical protein AB0B21_34600 [Streptomyces rimosus]|uniref:hypothetical protein n=1 Tax=Streptomyces rimosus TaxID=1927 RepID=UPI000AC626A7|nr:hypothetical protein [Streptomyces rimosus]
MGPAHRVLEPGHPRAAHVRAGARDGLPATEGKRGDPRWPAFARRHGLDPAHPVQWEVEALEPHELQRLVLAVVDPYSDRQVLAEQIAREEAQRRALADFLGGWGTASG